MWAKSAYGVLGLGNVFANGKLYFTHDVPEANRLPQGLEPLPHPLPSCSQTCQTSCQTLNQECSQTCCPDGRQACSWSAHPCGTCAALQSQILLSKNNGTQSQVLSRAEHASQQTVPGSFVVHMPSCLHVLFRVARLLHSNWGCEEPSFGACSLEGERIPLRTATYYARGGGVKAAVFLPLQIFEKGSEPPSCNTVWHLVALGYFQ